MAYNNHEQQWDTVILRKNKPTPTKTDEDRARVVGGAAMGSASSKPLWKIEQMVDDPNAKRPLEFVKKEEAQKIVQARVAAKLSQQELAQRLNMQKKDLEMIEQCKAVENKAVLAKIKRYLHIS
jgi:ribosome-binding protein aMBF1 (putative translation factor)